MAKWKRCGKGIWIAQYYLKRGDETWCVVVRRDDYRDGKQKVLRAGPDRKDATLFASRILRELETTGTDTAPFADALCRFLEEHARTLGDGTEQLYRGRVENHLIPRLGNVGIRDLRLAHFFDYAIARFEDAKPNTVHGELRLARTVLNWYWEEFDIDARCPARFIQRAFRQACEKACVTPTKRREDYTAEEVEILLRHAKAHPNPDALDLFVLGATMGLRKGEILGMEWTGIDWEAGTYNPVYQVNKVGKPKKLKAPRKHPAELSPLALAILRTRALRNGFGRWVFSTKNGTPYSGNNVQRWFKKIREEAQVEGVPFTKTFHCIRHYFASQAAEAGWSWPAIQNQLGHADAAFTAKQYTHPVRSQRNWDWGVTDTADKSLTTLTENPTLH